MPGTTVRAIVPLMQPTTPKHEDLDWSLVAMGVVMTLAIAFLAIQLV